MFPHGLFDGAQLLRVWIYTFLDYMHVLHSLVKQGIRKMYLNQYTASWNILVIDSKMQSF